jgi:glycosyltransferase involved in cell wall biosynthesis
MDMPLSTLMVSTSYPKNLTDWRGLFIRHLADALSARPDIRLKLWAPPGERASAVEDVSTPAESVWLNNLLESGGIAHLLRQRKRLGAPFKLLWLLRRVYKRHPQATVLHVNWLQNALPLCCLGGKQPALISVLGTDMGLLRVPGMRFSLRRVFRQRPCILAPNAEWMVPKLEEYFGDLAQVRAIPFGIDQRWYDLQRNWQSGPRRWLVVSRLTQDKIGPLFEWGAAYFQNSGDELHLFGPMQETMQVPDWVHYHGPTHPQDLLDNWFPQAAGLLTLSRHAEGRPQVMLEAMAAGLPIIASRLPAHDNLLSHRQTGCLTDNAEDFRAALDWLSEPTHNQTIGGQARDWVKQHIGTWADCAQRYVTAYHDLLELRA